MNQYFVWVGAGWYAARTVGDETHYHFMGNDKAHAPDTLALGLGAPEWFDSVPAWATA